MRRIAILFPRLDVMFKQGYVPEERGPIAPIRVYWKDFAENLADYHSSCGDHVIFIEKPLWQFTSQLVEDFACDITYIPHKSVETFPIKAGSGEIRYYMQAVFPFMFYVDSKGFAGGASFYPLKIDHNAPSTGFYDDMIERARRNESKFDQPRKREIRFPEKFVFFPCQIPHDETIKYHSNVTVEQALEATCQATRFRDINLIVKGHPVNRESMAPLKSICDKYNHTIWIDDVSIHDIIPHSHAVVCVNSGTGMEALLHKRPVITFGRCEYDCVTNVATTEDIINVLANPTFDEKEVRAFYDTWYQLCVDSRNKTSFTKL